MLALEPPSIKLKYKIEDDGCVELTEKFSPLKKGIKASLSTKFSFEALSSNCPIWLALKESA